jgi:hypothetical protein
MTEEIIDGLQEEGQQGPETADEAATEPEVTSTGEEEQPDAEAEPDDEDRERKGLMEAMRAERRKRQEAERERSELQQLIEKLREQPQQQPSKPVGGEPKLEDFDDYEQYQRALIRHEAQGLAQQQAMQQHRQQVFSQFQQRVESAKGRPEDYVDTIAAVFTDQNLPISEPMAEVILQSDAGPDIAYYLKSNPTEMQRIASKPWAMQAKELGRLEERLAAGAVTVSRAPKPVTPVGGAAASGAVDPEKLSMDDWVKWRRQQLSSRKR